MGCDLCLPLIAMDLGEVSKYNVRGTILRIEYCSDHDPLWPASASTSTPSSWSTRSLGPPRLLVSCSQVRTKQWCALSSVETIHQTSFKSRSCATVVVQKSASVSILLQVLACPSLGDDPGCANLKSKSRLNHKIVIQDLILISVFVNGVILILGFQINSKIKSIPQPHRIWILISGF